MNDNKSDLHSNNTGKNHEDPVLTARTSGRSPEIKVNVNLAKAMGYVSARTFQAFLSRRY